MVTRGEISWAADSAERAQRNYDLSKPVKDEDIKTLIHAARKAPTKQNETHYQIDVITDIITIRKIYDTTKHFTVWSMEDFDKIFNDSDESGLKTDPNYQVKNSQILAPLLFVYSLDSGDLRGGHHHAAGLKAASERAKAKLLEQRSYSIGLSTGQLILSASLLGYKTGICSAFDGNDVDDILNITESRLLVGIGYPKEGLERSTALETLNSELPEKYRNGAVNELWNFPSFDKTSTIKLNGEVYEK